MSMRKVRLLLVDDDPAAIKAMSHMLAQYPDQRFATSGAVALKMAHEVTPDLILMDIDMPGMTGLEVCDALQADPVLVRVPVIFASSHTSSAQQVAALQKGAADFVSKPLVASKLLARVRARLYARQIFEDLKPDSLPLASPQQPTSGKPAKLLIVDDDIASIHILRHTLAAMGELHFARTGEEALQLAHRLMPDLILLDAHMPGVDGFDVCRSLKAQASFLHVPIVFVTRFSDPRYEMRALDLGAADFIAKPYTAAVLQARVRNLIDLKWRTDTELAAMREHWRRIGDARVADIVDAASDAIVSYNCDEKVVLINAAACRMFLVSPTQAIGSPAHVLLGRQQAGEEACHAGSRRDRISRTNGDSISVECSTSTVGEGAECLTTVILRDISDRERLEIESHARIEAEAASRTKTSMMAYIAHEMGNPLNGLVGFSELMGADDEHPLVPAQAKRLEFIRASCRHLQTLLRDVLDLGCFESGKLTIALCPVDVAGCVEEAIIAVTAQAEKAGVTVSYESVPSNGHVTADVERLHQCLLNLLTNAIKYNQRGGWARVEVTHDAREFAISVRDSGPGLDALQRQHLFEPFNRLGRQHASAPGAGLGLVITRQLVEAMHGQLRVDSEPGQGCCFTIVLPRSTDTESL